MDATMFQSIPFVGAIPTDPSIGKLDCVGCATDIIGKGDIIGEAHFIGNSDSIGEADSIGSPKDEEVPKGLVGAGLSSCKFARACL